MSEKTTGPVDLNEKESLYNKKVRFLQGRLISLCFGNIFRGDGFFLFFADSGMVVVDNGLAVFNTGVQERIYRTHPAPL